MGSSFCLCVLLSFPGDFYGLAFKLLFIFQSYAILPVSYITKFLVMHAFNFKNVLLLIVYFFFSSLFLFYGYDSISYLEAIHFFLVLISFFSLSPQICSVYIYLTFPWLSSNAWLSLIVIYIFKARQGFLQLPEEMRKV